MGPLTLYLIWSLRGFFDLWVKCDTIFVRCIYTTGSSAISGSDNTYEPAGTGPIHLTQLECTGDEGSLFLCDSNPIITCPHSQDAAIICEPKREESAHSYTDSFVLKKKGGGGGGQAAIHNVIVCLTHARQ